MPVPQALHQNITLADLMEKGGGTPDARKAVLFDSNPQWKVPQQFAKKPLEAPPALEKEMRAEYEMMGIEEKLPVSVTFDEARVALARVLYATHGGAPRSVSNSPFKIPQDVSVPVGYDHDTGILHYEDVPSDWMSIPGLDEAQACISTNSRGVYANFQFRRYQHDVIKGFLAFVREELANNSIYRNQIVSASHVAGSHLDLSFISVASIDPSKNVYALDVQRLLDTWAKGAILYPVEMQESGQKKKVCICLAGPPGTGKTIYIGDIQKTTITAGGSGLVLPPGAPADMFEYARQFGRRIQTGMVPFLITGEDIERMAKGDRAKALEAMDGMDSKNDRLLTILTTNFPERLDAAQVRPGRIDRLIHVGLPDVYALQRLFELQMGDKLEDGIDWNDVFPHFEGYTPSWIVGSGEDIVRSAIVRTGSTDYTVNGDDLKAAADGYRWQFEMQRAAENYVEPTPPLDVMFRQIVEASVVEHIGEAIDYDEIYSQARSAAMTTLQDARMKWEDPNTGNRVTGTVVETG